MIARPAPRDFTPAGLLGAGLPGDRGARVAARQAFVHLKLTFMQAVHDLPEAGWLRTLVQGCEEPVDLWLLRAPVFALLQGPGADLRSRRQLLRRGLDSVFPDLEPQSGFGAF